MRPLFAVWLRRVFININVIYVFLLRYYNMHYYANVVTRLTIALRYIDNRVKSIDEIDSPASLGIRNGRSLCCWTRFTMYIHFILARCNWYRHVITSNEYLSRETESTWKANENSFCNKLRRFAQHSRRERIPPIEILSCACVSYRVTYQTR